MEFKNWYKDKMFETDLGYVINGDCTIVLKEIIEQGAKVDAIITDIPQGITKNEWDTVIPLELMWEFLYKLRRDKRTPIVLFTNQPFTTDLIESIVPHSRDFNHELGAM